MTWLRWAPNFDDCAMLIGDNMISCDLAVGKTALVIRFGNGTFQETYANIIGYASVTDPMSSRFLPEL